MKVALSTPGKFHLFDLARELHAQGALAGICSGYPRFKLREEQLPPELIHTFPWVKTPYMAFKWRDRLPRRVVAEWENLIARSFDRWTARNLPSCDVFVGLSGSALDTGRKVQLQGGRYVCDRGSAHIRVQDQILREEHDRWGLKYPGIDLRTIEREEAEYEQSDAITVPSGFARRTFVSAGVSERKLHLLPYGVNLSRFEPSGSPPTETFDVLFVGGMSLQKGIPYLVKAFLALHHPAKRLYLVGTPSKGLVDVLKNRGLWSPQIDVVGHIPQHQLKHLMSKCHVMVLPSVQDGFGMVMAQAMACGCPVIASENTGARDLLSDGQDGFVVPIRDVDAITERLQQLADDPALRLALSTRALARVKGLGGWSDYGERAMQTYLSLVKP